MLLILYNIALTSHNLALVSHNLALTSHNLAPVPHNIALASHNFALISRKIALTVRDFALIARGESQAAQKSQSTLPRENFAPSAKKRLAANIFAVAGARNHCGGLSPM